MNAKKVFRALALFVLLTAWLMAGVASQSLAGVYDGKSSLAAKREALPVRQIIVKYRASAKLATAAAARSAAPMQRLDNTAGVALEYFRPMSGEAHVLRLPQRMTVERALEISARLAAMPDVEYAEPDYIVQATGNAVADVSVTPNDPRYPDQWHYFAPGTNHYGVDAPAAWAITTGSASIYTAVIDTGILDHADLSGRWVGGYDFVTDTTYSNDGDGRDPDPHDPGDWVAAGECGADSSAEDSSWHGTHVAGTIGAASNNGAGVAGLNWVSQIVPLRVLGKCGGTTSDVVDAMRWAAGLSVSGVPANTHPARVINMSLGGASPLTGCPAVYQDAVNEVVAAGSVVVVSAGNNREAASYFMPANCSGVITVTATNRTGGLTYYSNFGGAVAIAAPGGEQDFVNDPNGVLSTLNTGTTTPVASPSGDTYAYYQGTSMAAPHVTGIVSLMLSVNAALTPAQVTNILQATATPFPVGTGDDCTTSICGSGIANAPAAITMAQSVNGSPTVLSTDPASGASGVPVAKVIKAVFSKPMNAATITAASFTLDKGVTGSVSYDPATYTATFTPDPPGLANSTSYTATITTAVADAGGAHMATEKSWSFITGEPFILANGGFEDGTAAWTQSSSGKFELIFDDGLNSRGGVGYAWLGGYEGALDILSQDVTIPADATAAAVRFWYDIATGDSSTTAHDILTLTVKDPTTGEVRQTLTTLSNLNETTEWVQSSQYDLLAYKGQTIRLTFTGTTNSDGLNTSFFLDDVEFPVTLPPKNLTVAISGNGSVNSNPSGIACTTGNSGTCAHQFPLDSMVTLMPSPAADFLFGSWTGCASLDGDNCLVQMTADKNVTANFTSLQPVHIVGGGYYDSFQLAYIPAPASCTIQAKAVELAGDFTPNNGKTVLLRGGYDSAFSSNSGGYTVINGKLTIQSGSLTIENLVIR